MSPRLFFFLAWLCSSTLLPAQLVPADTAEGRTSLAYENDPFTNYSAGDGGAGFVKVAIILSDPGTVYFQDSNLYPFHFDFATQRLQPFLGMSRAQFDAVSLRRAGQKVVLGAVLFPPFGGPHEFGVQFVGSDPYPKESVKAWFNVVKAALSASPPATAIYIPSFEQKAQAETDREYYSGQGIVVDGIERWITSDAVYANGWAFGRLIFVPGEQIAAAYSAGTLRPTDVLLTDGVPAEVPFLAGILTLSAATPNSHVAILARNQRVPFAWISAAAEQARVRELVGREVLVRAAQQGAEPLQISAADEDLAPGVRARILAQKASPQVQVSPRKHLGKLSADAATLRPDDIRYFGGKASNFGLLRRAIPDNSPRALAFSFDLWEQFLANVNPDSELTLGAEIDQRLGGFTWPPNISAASAALAGVRDLIRKKIEITDAQKVAILGALASEGFAPTRMLRFRSSSNAEDTAEFSGAGLYESFNGCIADSQDGNDDGPCQCAADEPDEKSVLKAIEKVFASFYNDNAWLERLRFGIRERQVGMAVLVHENAPDADELANGVVTITRRPGFTPGNAEFEFRIVTQLGAASVTNPEGGAKPEIVVGGQSGRAEPYVFTEQHSDLVALGANVMNWESDYRDLTALLVKVTRGYAQLFPEKQTFTLDLEFKKLQPGRLEVKQVRELPQTDTQLVTPILLNEPVELIVLQTESSDVFAYHRLKSVLAAATRNTPLTPSALQAPLHRASAFDFILNGAPAQLGSGGPQSWPGYLFRAPNSGVQVDSWFAGSAAQRVDFRWRTRLPTQVDAAVSPVITQRDGTQVLSALYRTPQPFIDFAGKARRRTSDSATLIPRDSFLPDDEVQKRRIETPGGVVVAPEFRWPKYRGFVIIKTLPLAAWERTTITGLTTAPLVLTNDFAQTYAPGHHNFTESFLFEPTLDPGVTTAQRTELAAADIRLIHVFHDRALGLPDAMHVVGFDGKVRTLP